MLDAKLSVSLKICNCQTSRKYAIVLDFTQTEPNLNVFMQGIKTHNFFNILAVFWWFCCVNFCVRAIAEAVRPYKPRPLPDDPYGNAMNLSGLFHPWARALLASVVMQYCILYYSCEVSFSWIMSIPKKETNKQTTKRKKMNKIGILQF